MNRSRFLYFILLAILILPLIGVLLFNFSITEVAAYIFSFIGIYAFLNSYLKKYKFGLIGGSILFLAGVIIFTISQYEILNLGSIFIPIVLVVVGVSVLFNNILLKFEPVWISFSLLCLFAGIWMIVSRTEINQILFFSAVYSIIKSYWLIVIGMLVIIFVVLKFKKNS